MSTTVWTSRRTSMAASGTTCASVTASENVPRLP